MSKWQCWSLEKCSSLPLKLAEAGCIVTEHQFKFLIKTVLSLNANQIHYLLDIKSVDNIFLPQPHIYWSSLYLKHGNIFELLTYKILFTASLLEV